MASTSLQIGAHLMPSSASYQTRTRSPLFHRTHYGGFSRHKHFLRGSLSVAKLGLHPGPSFPDPDNAESVIRELFGRAEGFLYTIADAAVSTSDAAVSSSDTVSGTKQSSDWFSGITNIMESVLKVLKDGLSTLHVPYAYGFAIILLTILVKAATFPLSKKQVESAMAMRSLQPQVKAVQQRYAGDQERMQLEIARLYKLAGINPLAGCLPTLATIPVWIGLYRALSNVANEGLLTEGFFWIPSLAGPTTVAARQSGSGISWLFPFVDGHPPLGWSDTLAYLVLPVLLVVSQYLSVQIMQSSQPQSNDPAMKSSQALTKFLPLMIGYFALSVPSGLSLYWFTNNILSTAQQIWLQKLGGANSPVLLSSDDTLKEDMTETLKSLTATNSSKNETKTAEKLTPEGLRPGERFMKIKEEEARRKREEEKRKAEEVSGKEVWLTNDSNKKEKDVIERETNVASGNGIPVVNVNPSPTDETKEETRMENIEQSVNGRVDGRDIHNSYEDKADEVYSITINTDNEPGEDGPLAKMEGPSAREEA